MLAKLTLAAVAAALAALLVWIAVRRFGVPVLAAAVVVGVFAASAPLAAYGSQIYPELPAALAGRGRDRGADRAARAAAGWRRSGSRSSRCPGCR